MEITAVVNSTKRYCFESQILGTMVPRTKQAAIQAAWRGRVKTSGTIVGASSIMREIKITRVKEVL